MRRSFLVLAAASAGASRLRGRGASGDGVANPEEYMSILGGTQNYGSRELSFGNIMPDVTLPWGAWLTPRNCWAA